MCHIIVLLCLCGIRRRRPANPPPGFQKTAEWTRPKRPRSCHGDRPLCKLSVQTKNPIKLISCIISTKNQYYLNVETKNQYYFNKPIYSFKQRTNINSMLKRRIRDISRELSVCFIPHTGPALHARRWNNSLLKYNAYDLQHELHGLL